MGSAGSGRQRPKRPNSFADFLVQFRWVLIVPIVLPLSFLFYQYIQWRATVRRLIHGPPSEETHRRAIKKVQDRIKSRRPKLDGMICTGRRPWLEVSMRHSEHKRSHRFEVDLSHLTDIVWVDRERMLIKCEPMVCMSEVSAAVLPLGMAPQVLPELDDLTVGGVINGYGVEGSSHLFGLFSDTCVAYELVLADGALVRATADNEYSDLFHAVPWSHGSIGLLVGAEFRLTPVKEYMKVTYSPVTGTLDDIASHYLESYRLPQNDYEEKVPDFVETMIFNHTNAVITTGRYASREEATRKGNVINEIGWWYKPWFHTHVATALKRGKFIEYVPAREYHHRHTRSLYWEGVLIVPMGNHPLFRFFLGWLMPPKITCQHILSFCSLNNYTSQLESYGSRADREKYNLTEALLFLSHFMGDVHQPLHVGFSTDEGGNTIILDWYSQKSNLHHPLLSEESSMAVKKLLPEYGIMNLRKKVSSWVSIKSIYLNRF